MGLEPIQIVGIKELDDMERDTVQRLSGRYFGKIERELKNEIGVRIHVKKHRNKGRQCSYAVNVHVIAPTKTVVSTKASGWDLTAALHESFHDVIHRFHHTLHTDEQRHKPRQRAASIWG